MKVGDSLDTKGGSSLAEINYLEHLFEQSSGRARIKLLNEVESDGAQFPIYAIHVGNPKPSTPKLALVGGVHGIERIGAQVVIAYFETLINRLKWDQALNDQLDNVEVVLIPIVNPVGMLRGWRSNGSGVDIMRNAPLDAEEKASPFVGGHRLGAWLPWYRGKNGHPLQDETKAVMSVVENYLFSSPFSMVLDCHSGFGMEDRIWFPYACSSRPPENIAEIYTLKSLFTRTYPYQNYIFEPQCKHYITHGDVWDYLYRQSLSTDTTFIPLTLELGSWRWVMKNPMQLFSFAGLFNPVKSHRLQRALRRHNVLLEFLLRSAHSYRSWLPSEKDKRAKELEARSAWYE